MHQQHKDALIKYLRSSKSAVERVKNDLAKIEGEDAESARKELLNTEFSIIRAIHHIGWIGEKHDEVLQDKT